jgi:hypothetical protein
VMTKSRLTPMTRVRISVLLWLAHFVNDEDVDRCPAGFKPQA